MYRFETSNPVTMCRGPEGAGRLERLGRQQLKTLAAFTSPRDHVRLPPFTLKLVNPDTVRATNRLAVTHPKLQRIVFPGSSVLLPIELRDSYGIRTVGFAAVQHAIFEAGNGKRSSWAVRDSESDFVGNRDDNESLVI